jgi:hypothetical protein
MRLLAVILLLASTALSLPTDNYTVRGSVRDAASGELLAAANIRLLGTSRGTISNADGQFSLALDPGAHRLIVSMLGYRTDTVGVLAAAGERADVRLEPSAIVLPEIVVSAEDPAMEIIRRAIANKKRWIDRLQSYEMQAFTRQTIRRDTAVAAINESYSRGYWQTGDTLREIVTQRRQTANVASAFNVASVGRILNFSDDEIRFLGYTFVGPTAQDALEYYDYKLLRTRTGFGQDIYEIRMIPRTRTVPLFQGSVTIADGSYALIGVDVQPNVAFRIPFLREATIQYRQQFGLYESSYWMPSDIRIEGEFTIGVVGFTFPRIGFSQTSVISDYSINTVLPDSIFRKPRLLVDSSAARFDSAYWAANAVLPLSRDEEHAYRTLDSTQTLEVQFRPGGAAMTLGTDAGAAGILLSYADAFFNRVEGFHLGAHLTLDSLDPLLTVRAGWAYGFSDRRAKYSAGATLYTTRQRTLGFGADVYRRADHRPDRGYYSPLFNSLTCLISRNDYRDYHLAEGGRIVLEYRPHSRLRAELSFTAESHDSLTQATEYSFFSRSRRYRVNPPAMPGNFRSLAFALRLGQDPIPFDILLRDGIDIAVEHSSPGLTGGDFDFTRLDAVASLSVPTFARSYLLTPGFRIRASAGASAGRLPPQRWFSPETASGSFAPLGVMRGMDVKEFSGTGYCAVSVEHNFRTIPFLALGIPFLYENGIELIVHGGAARTWSEHQPVTPAITDGWYYESGASISRIFDLIRADFTWRLSRPTGFRFTVGLAGVL